MSMYLSRILSQDLSVSISQLKSLRIETLRQSIVLLLFTSLIGCGGGGSSPTSIVEPIATYSIGVSVTGLLGSGLVLQLNAANNTTVTQNGAFTFASQQTSGATYAVTILTQPTAPNQKCVVTNGQGTVANSNISNVAVACTLDLATMMTHTSVSPSLPGSVTSSIVQVVSSADAETIGTPLEIPTSSVGFPTPIFALDSSQNVLLEAYANSGSTELDAGTTATSFVISTIGLMASSSTTYNQLTLDVQSAAGYQALVSSISSNLSAGIPPLKSSAVIQSVATVVNQTLTLIAGSSPNGEIAHGQRRNSKRPVQEQTTLPTPVQIVGPFASLPTFESVYISGVTAAGGVNVSNSMPIDWVASSTDEDGNTLDSGEQLNASGLLVSLLTSPTPVAVAGNGQNFTLTIGQNSASKTANVKALVADGIGFSLSQVTGLAPSGLTACSASAADTILTNLGSSFQQLIISAPNGTAASALFAGQLTSSILFNGLRSALECALPGSASQAGVVAALANLTGWIAPTSAVWQAISFVSSIAGPATDTAFTWYYWNASQSMNVCESQGMLVSCGDFWQGSYTVTSCSAPGAIGEGGATSYCNLVMSWPAGPNENSGSISFRAGTSEAFNFRRDYTIGGSITTPVCKADTVSLTEGATGFTENIYVEDSYGEAGDFDPGSVTYTITSWTSDAISGTFTATVPYLNQQTGSNSDWVSGTMQGTWQVTPLDAPFPKCVPPSSENLYCLDIDGGVDQSPPDGTLIPCQQTFLPLSSPARPGEWQGIDSSSGSIKKPPSSSRRKSNTPAPINKRK